MRYYFISFIYRIVFIATGYLPDTKSESSCNEIIIDFTLKIHTEAKLMDTSHICKN